MKVQIIASGYVVNEDGRRRVYRRGQEAELPKAEAERAIEAGLVRKAGSDAELPPPNAGAVESAPTQPDGTPLEEDADGNELTEGETPAAEVETVNYRTHADADERAKALGISFQDGATVAAKNEAINAYLAASAGGVQATSEDLSELGDDELRERGIKYGLTEGELEELEHDALVLAVAEAMNARTADPAEQARENAAEPDSSEE